MRERGVKGRERKGGERGEMVRGRGREKEREKKREEKQREGRE